jgi:hypothetical protein
MCNLYSRETIMKRYPFLGQLVMDSARMKASFFHSSLFVILVLFSSAQVLRAAEFSGYECTDDCSGHAAGYRWADQHNIQDESACPLNGQAYSFWEGCKAYVEDPSRGAGEDDDGNSVDE